MKASLFLLPLLFFFGACKKKYTCECNTTYTFLTNNNTFYTIVIPGNKSPYSVKMSEKQALAACEHEQTATQTNFTNAVTDDGNHPFQKGESVSTSCGIK
jgi:hypothetical protein